MFKFDQKIRRLHCHCEFSGNSSMTLMMFPGDTVKSIHVPIHFTRELLNESLLSSTGMYS